MFFSEKNKFILRKKHYIFEIMKYHPIKLKNDKI